MSAQATSSSLSPHEAVPPSQRGPASRRIVVGYGFWLFLLSDIIMFAALFAAYAVLSHRTASGPGGAQLFHRGHTLAETGALLASTFSCGMLSLATRARSQRWLYVSALFTFGLGAAFVTLELGEFSDLIAAGAGPGRSAFLSAFFALVGLHGLHVAAGLLWLVVMAAQVATLGLRPMVTRRLHCFSLFWHALGIVWIGVFTIVYLGAR
ncbi:cytochrome c oxidase subunit 3 [Roseateles sp.]|uniref:cytochrome c oxidase subunit 3 n=1 Tax=Roseateles sp. TaxID=1971397 RepID=UPI0032651688